MYEEFYYFLSETLKVFKIYLQRVYENIGYETLTLIIFSLTYFSLLTLLRNLRQRVEERTWHLLRLGVFMITYALVLTFSFHLPRIDLFHLITVFLYVEILRSMVDTLRFFVPVSFLTKTLLTILILISGFLIFMQNISAGVSKLVEIYSFGFKLSSAFMLSLILLRIYAGFTQKMERIFLKRALRRAQPIFFILYIALTLLWVFGAVKVNQTFVIKLIALVSVLFAYITAQVYVITLLEKLLGMESEALRRDLRRFMNLIALFILYKGIGALFNLEPLITYLSNLYIINTDLVKVSVFSVVESIYVFLLLLALTSLAKDTVYLYFMRKNMEVEAGSLRALVSNVGILIAVVAALMNLGLTWKVMVPVAGALGIGIGFGLQTIFNNYVSGFILLLSRNIKVGDLVELEGSAGETIGRHGETIFGKVVNINILTTIVRTNDNFEIAIPNSEFVSGRIVNYSMSDPYIRVRIPFGVSYSSDPKKVRDILIRVAKEFEVVLKDPPPRVWFYEMGDSALIFYLLVWVDIRRFWRMKALRSEIYFRAWEELKKEGIEIPFPQRDVWFKNKLKVEIDEGRVSKRGSEGGKEGF